LALNVFPWSERAAKAGFARDAVYLVRPDGYVGWTGTAAEGLEAYFARHRVASLG